MMSDHLRTLISLGSLACWLGCVLAAARLLALLRVNFNRHYPCNIGGLQSGAALSRIQAITLAALPLACFLFIPPGSLPPFVDIYWGGLVCLALLWLSISLQSAALRDKSFYLRRLPCAIILSASWLVLGCGAAALGLPGGPFSLGSYAAEPVWRWPVSGYGLSAAGIEGGGNSFVTPAFLMACTGLALMLAGVLKAMSLFGNTANSALERKVRETRKDHSFADALNMLAMLTITAVLFVPLGGARSLGVSPLTVFIFDYFGFWAVVFLLFFSVRIFGPVRWTLLGAGIAALLWLAGAALFIFA